MWVVFWVRLYAVVGTLGILWVCKEGIKTIWEK